MADLEYFFDPVCPFAWITSRWVVEVQGLRDYEVTWRFINLKMINEHRIGTDSSYDAKYQASHMIGLYAHRVIDQVRIDVGNEAVGRMYTACGTAIHIGRRRDEAADDPRAFMAKMLAECGLPVELAAHVDETSHDAYIRADSDLAFSRTGPNVGTPILTFHPGQHDEGSFFGPVISKTPRGADALRLWDAVETVATASSMAELKRSNRDPLDFT
jgi:hypothetical protein